MTDICFVIPPQNRGWILDHIAHEIGKYHTGEATYAYRYDTLPPAKVYWLSHYSILPQVTHLNPHIHPSQFVTFFTHTSSELVSFVPYFNKCKAVIAECPLYVNDLRAAGVNETLIHMVPESADSELFKPHIRTGNGSVLVSGSYRRRKNFDAILAIIKLLPNRHFKIVTQLLDKWERYAEISSLPNVEIFNSIPHESYPAVYATCDVYLSCATVEGGGPNALIESMHSNLMPVVSDVGNAREFIVHGHNGYIFPVDAAVQDVAKLIELAYSKKVMTASNYNPLTDVSATVASYTWKEYATNMLEIMLPEQYLNDEGFILKHANCAD